MLDTLELLELEEIIKNKLEELESILSKLNRTGELDDFLKLLGINNYLEEDTTQKNGKIIVIGKSDVDKNALEAVAKQYGIAKERFEFYLNYNDAKTFDFKKIQWSSRYSCILVGQMPHSGNAKGKYGSIISAIELEEGYPPVIKMGTNGLKITKASFRSAMGELIREKKIA